MSLSLVVDEVASLLLSWHDDKQALQDDNNGVSELPDRLCYLISRALSRSSVAATSSNSSAEMIRIAITRVDPGPDLSGNALDGTDQIDSIYQMVGVAPRYDVLSFLSQYANRYSVRLEAVELALSYLDRHLHSNMTEGLAYPTIPLPERTSLFRRYALVAFDLAVKFLYLDRSGFTGEYERLCIIKDLAGVDMPGVGKYEAYHQMKVLVFQSEKKLLGDLNYQMWMSTRYSVAHAVVDGLFGFSTDDLTDDLDLGSNVNAAEVVEHVCELVTFQLDASLASISLAYGVEKHLLGIAAVMNAIEDVASQCQLKQIVGLSCEDMEIFHDVRAELRANMRHASSGNLSAY